VDPDVVDAFVELYDANILRDLDGLKPDERGVGSTSQAA